MYFIVQSGLTRRLVEADSIDDAHAEFLKARVMWHHIDLEDAIEIWPASDAELADFQKRARRPAFDDQEQLELDDIRAGYGEGEHS